MSSLNLPKADETASGSGFGRIVIKGYLEVSLSVIGSYSAFSAFHIAPSSLTLRGFPVVSKRQAAWQEDICGVQPRSGRMRRVTFNHSTERANYGGAEERAVIKTSVCPSRFLQDGIFYPDRQ